MFLPLEEDEDFYYFYLYGPYRLKLGKTYDNEEGPFVVIQTNNDGEIGPYNFDVELTDADEEFEVSKYTLANGQKGDMEHPVSRDGSFSVEENTIRMMISRSDRIVRALCPGYKISNWEHELFDDEKGSALKFEYGEHIFLVAGFGNELYDVYKDGQYWQRIEAHSEFEAKDLSIMEFEANG